MPLEKKINIEKTIATLKEQIVATQAQGKAQDAIAELTEKSTIGELITLLAALDADALAITMFSDGSFGIRKANQATFLTPPMLNGNFKGVGK